MMRRRYFLEPTPPFLLAASMLQQDCPLTRVVVAIVSCVKSKVVVVLINGGPIALPEPQLAQVGAVLEAFYPGQYVQRVKATAPGIIIHLARTSCCCSWVLFIILCALFFSSFLLLLLLFIFGRLGGPAIVDVLFGRFNPGGKLPYTM